MLRRDVAGHSLSRGSRLTPGRLGSKVCADEAWRPDVAVGASMNAAQYSDKIVVEIDLRRWFRGSGV